VKRRTRRALLAAVALVCAAVAAAAQDAAWEGDGERILDYDSRIAVDVDGALTVSETIAVVAAGDEIKRGIYRDFPTTYHVPVWGGGPEIPFADFGGGPLLSYRVAVPFAVVSVERDGQREPYHLADTANGVRVYAGAENVLLPPGRHVYRFTYTTARQLGFFPDHDELYWNVTGNGWIFPIERAAATVILPAAIPRAQVKVEGYTGARGSRARDLTATVDAASGELRFATTRELDRYEGLTIVASFPKGFVVPPGPSEHLAALLRANPIFLYGPLGLAAVMLYFFAAWVRVGRDPSRGTIIPLFAPPLGLDAAGLRYVAGMGYDERCFTAALVGLGVKGWARIEEASGEVTVHPSKARDEPLGPGEQKVQKALLGNGACELKQANHKRIAAAVSGLREALQREYDGKMFRANRGWAIPGLILSAVAVLAAGFSGRFEQSIGFAFMLVWLTGWTFACFHLGSNVWRTWREVFRPDAGFIGRGGNLVLALIMTAFSLPFFAGEVLGLTMLITASSAWMAIFVLCLVAMNFLFYHLLKQPTLAGRVVMDQIEGFKMYLTTAEGAELAQAVPEKTPQLYERLLPYAIALGVENQWTEQFEDVLRRAATGADGTGYRPRWYSGSLNRVGAQHFAAALTSSLATRVSSSSTAPGSRSGGGGGGSSGGGGGGGGGGGW